MVNLAKGLNNCRGFISFSSRRSSINRSSSVRLPGGSETVMRGIGGRCRNVVTGGGGNPNFTLRSTRKEGVDFDVLRIE